MWYFVMQLELTDTPKDAHMSVSGALFSGAIQFFWKRHTQEGGVKMAEEQDGEITFSSTNSSKEQQNGEQSLQNNF